MSSCLIEVPLGLELVFPGGRVRHDYSQLPAPRVVRALARAHLSLTNSGGGIKTPGTSGCTRARSAGSHRSSSESSPSTRSARWTRTPTDG